MVDFDEGFLLAVVYKTVHVCDGDVKIWDVHVFVRGVWLRESTFVDYFSCMWLEGRHRSHRVLVTLSNELVLDILLIEADHAVDLVPKIDIDSEEFFFSSVLGREIENIPFDRESFIIFVWFEKSGSIHYRDDDWLQVRPEIHVIG